MIIRVMGDKRDKACNIHREIDKCVTYTGKLTSV